MITQESAAREAVIYADDANFYRSQGQPIFMRVKWLCVIACEAAGYSARLGASAAERMVRVSVGREDDRDIFRTRGAV